MEHNMSFLDIALHYALVMVLGIFAGVLRSPEMIFVVMAVLLMAILGYNPIFHILGIDHSDDFEDI